MALIAIAATTHVTAFVVKRQVALPGTTLLARLPAARRAGALAPLNEEPTQRPQFTGQHVLVGLRHGDSAGGAVHAQAEVPAAVAVLQTSVRRHVLYSR